MFNAIDTEEKMKHISFTLILLFLLFACSTTQNNTQKLNSTLGMSKSDLIRYMGQPSGAKILNDGTEILSYTTIDNVYVPSEFYNYNQGALANEYDPFYAPFLGDYDFSPYGDSFGYNVEYFCKTVFVLEKGTVTSWKQKGNDCR